MAHVLGIATEQAGAAGGRDIRAVVASALSVVDVHKRQCVRRRRPTRIRTQSARRERRKIVPAITVVAARRHDHRANERPHHMAQKRVRRNLEPQPALALKPTGRIDRPRKRSVLRLSRRKRTKIVPASIAASSSNNSRSSRRGSCNSRRHCSGLRSGSSRTS